jgi:hypothetical protein
MYENSVVTFLYKINTFNIRKLQILIKILIIDIDIMCHLHPSAVINVRFDSDS